MDGVLLVDKPAGPTSHDVVARLRRVARERRIGHTGTLDPRATGLLLLVLGKATRLAAMLTGLNKRYEAMIRLGVATDTDDADGRVVSVSTGARPDAAAIDAALAGFRGTFGQVPPAHSAKKVGGRKAYDLARRDVAPTLPPATVTVRELSWTRLDDDLLGVTVLASSGFYVRALARDLGRVLGCGAHLEALRRTAVGTFDVGGAITLADAERLGTALASRLLSPAEALADVPAVTVTAGGLKRALHGNTLNPEHLEGRFVPVVASAGAVRVLDQEGHLVAIAYARGGILHPAIVLG